MKETRIAVRYAKALFDLALEKSFLESAYNDMKLVNDICKTNKDFLLLLQNPIINNKKKVAVLKAIFAKHLHEISLSFLSLIANKNREIYLYKITEEFIKLYREHKNLKTAYITTAEKIDQDIRKEIIEKFAEFSTAEIELVEETKSDLLGGFILTIDDKQYDASILRKMKKLKKEFNENIYISKF